MNSPFLCFVFFLLAISSDVKAESFSSGDYDSRPKNLPLPKETPIDSVDPRNGNLIVRHKDLFIPGNGGLDIAVYRTYDLNELSAGLAASYKLSYQWTALGAGWKLGAAPTLTAENSYSYYDGQHSIMDSRFNYKGLCSGQFSANTISLTTSYISLELPEGTKESFWPTAANTALSKNNWKLTCYSNVIRAYSPSGTVFEFGNINSDVRIGKYTLGSMADPFGYQIQTLSVSYMQAKAQTDKFGNSLTYQYINFGTPIAPWEYLPTSGAVEATSSQSWVVEKPTSLISSITSSDGRSVSFSYTAQNGRLTSIADNTGRTWGYAYQAVPESPYQDPDNSRLLTEVTLPTGKKWGYQYGAGIFRSANTLLGEQELYPLNVATATTRKLTKITYPEGGNISYGYGYNNISAQIGKYMQYAKREHISSRVLSTGHGWNYTFARGGAGQYDTTTVVGPEGTTTFKYMGAGYSIYLGIQSIPNVDNAWRVGQLMEKTDPTGSTETYVWQQREISPWRNCIHELGYVCDTKVWAADLQKKTVVRNGATYTTTYSNHDIYGNPGTVVESGPNGGSRTTVKTYFNNTTEWVIGKLKDESFSGSSTTRTYFPSGKLNTVTIDGVSASYTYTLQGDVSTKTDARGFVTTYSDYKRGIPRAESQPEGISISRVVSDAGNVTSETNGENWTTTYSYDGLNRVTSIVPPIGLPTGITYTSTTKTATRGGFIDITSFDGFGRIASKTIGGIQTTFAYDALGRVSFVSNPGSTVGTSFEYDALGRLTKRVNADSTYSSIVYGASSKTVTDERNNATTYSYRSYGDPGRQWLMGITTPVASANIAIGRNSADLMTTVAQGGFTRTYGYNANNYLSSVLNPETGTTTYGRDAAGNMTSRKVGASNTVNYSYDGQGRRSAITYPAGTPSVTFTYDKNNRPLTVNSAAANRSYLYDANGNRTVESLAIDGYTFVAGYGYNNLDQLSSVTYPQTGSVINYAPDVLGRPTQASGYASSATYWPSGQINQLTYTNGTTTTYGQNARLWPATFSAQKGSTVYLNHSYGYDNVGNLTSISDSIDTTYNRTFGHDGLSRINSATGSWGTNAISYDGVGNITSQVYPTYTVAYTYNSSNLLTATQGQSLRNYTHDAYGNVITDAAKTFQYDDAPNMKCAFCGTSSALNYVYDGNNLRVSTTKNAVKAYEFHDINGKLLMEYTPSSTGFIEYIYLGDKRIAQRGSPATKLTWMHNDAAGTPMLATEGNGNILWKEAYSPYGARLKKQTYAANYKLFFAGKSAEGTTGLSYFGARYYDPTIGRFFAVDPVDFKSDNPHSFNRYAYGNNNPNKFIDPDGRQPSEIMGMSGAQMQQYAEAQRVMSMASVQMRLMQNQMQEGITQLKYMSVGAGAVGVVLSGGAAFGLGGAVVAAELGYAGTAFSALSVFTDPSMLKMTEFAGDQARDAMIKEVPGMAGKALQASALAWDLSKSIDDMANAGSQTPADQLETQIRNQGQATWRVMW
jgi:RHS repeat-associated protein